MIGGPGTGIGGGPIVGGPVVDGVGGPVGAVGPVGARMGGVDVVGGKGQVGIRPPVAHGGYHGGATKHKSHITTIVRPVIRPIVRPIVRPVIRRVGTENIGNATSLLIILHITKIYLYNYDPLKPYFCIL